MLVLLYQQTRDLAPGLNQIKIYWKNFQTKSYLHHCTEVRFASFLSGGFTTMAVMNPPKKKLKKRISVQCLVVASKNLFNHHRVTIIKNV